MELGTIRVVIAEDEAIIRLDLKEILEGAGYVVVGETGRGDDAVKLVDEYLPDLVLLDVKMPGLDGVSAAREITTRHRMPVVVLTAFSQRELIDEAREAGVDAYLVKPFRQEELLPKLASVMASHQQEVAIEAEALKENPDGSQASEDKIETRRVVEAAKSILMDQHGLTEPDAFGFVQRTAMGTRSRMRDVAQQVLDGELAP